MLPIGPVDYFHWCSCYVKFPFISSDRVVGGGIYGAGAWTTVPPFVSGSRGGQEEGMAEEIKSFLISFGTYLFFTFAWWALKAGFDAGELLDCMFSFIPLFEVCSDEGLTYIIFFSSVPATAQPVPWRPRRGPLCHQMVTLVGAAPNCRRRHRHHCLFFFFIYLLCLTYTVPELFFKKKIYNKV